MTTVMDLDTLARIVGDQVFAIGLYVALTGKIVTEPFTVTKTMLDDAEREARATMGEAKYQECVRLAQEEANKIFNICYRRNIEASRLKPPN
jgi:hypothetical protein